MNALARIDDTSIDAALAAFARAADAAAVDADPSVFADGCTAAFVLVGVDIRSPLSSAINRATGSRGFSHVYVDPCRLVDGERRVIDYSIRRGVHWASPDIYASRERVRVELPASMAAELWTCIRARIGRPLRVLPLALGRCTSDTCIGLAVACVPSSWREQLEVLREGPCISPNTLARWAGVA